MMTRRMVVWAALCAVAFAAFAEGPRVARRKPLTANVGVVSVGLDTYWKQCPGLLEDMVKKLFMKLFKIHVTQDLLK